MVALPLFDVVLCAQEPADRPSRMAGQLIESALSELQQIEKIDDSLAPADPTQFDRPTAALIRGMYEKWAADGDALLDRIAQVERRFGRLDATGRLRDAIGRTRAMLSVSLDDMEQSRQDISQGRLIGSEEVRRELRVGVR